MNLRDWRISQKLTLAAAALQLRLAGGGRSFQRIESGENSPDADVIERIRTMSAGVVTEADMHATRLAWLRENRPEKFAVAEAAE